MKEIFVGFTEHENICLAFIEETKKKNSLDTSSQQKSDRGKKPESLVSYIEKKLWVYFVKVVDLNL